MVWHPQADVVGVPDLFVILNVVPHPVEVSQQALFAPLDMLDLSFPWRRSLAWAPYALTWPQWNVGRAKREARQQSA